QNGGVGRRDQACKLRLLPASSRPKGSTFLLLPLRRRHDSRAGPGTSAPAASPTQGRPQQPERDDGEVVEGIARVQKRPSMAEAGLPKGVGGAGEDAGLHEQLERE